LRLLKSFCVITVAAFRSALRSSVALRQSQGDPQQDYFSDGITEDIITDLSRFSELLVIARNSSFQYKGKAIDIRRVARGLGAPYALEGSVRRICITAPLIAATGAHRWAERYDRQLHDVFAVQDEVARAIVALIAAHVKPRRNRSSAVETSRWLGGL
jgi:adenylate cyclase